MDEAYKKMLEDIEADYQNYSAAYTRLKAKKKKLDNGGIKYLSELAKYEDILLELLNRKHEILELMERGKK